MAENLTRRPGVLEWSSFQYPFAIHPKSSVWIWRFLGHQVEAMKTALDFRALVTDMLTLERRSRRSRLVSTQRQHTHTHTYSQQLVFCRPGMDEIQELKDIIRTVSGPRSKMSKAGNI